MFLIDSNVLIDIAENDMVWSNWSSFTLAQAAERGRVYINPIIYAEVSAAYADMEALDQVLVPLALERLDLPYEAAFGAARAYAQYRARGGVKQAILPDFLVGAHAAFIGATVVTRDPKPYRSYFPSVPLIAPTLS